MHSLMPLLLILTCCLFSIWLHSSFNKEIIETGGFWFGADFDRVFEKMSQVSVDLVEYRHPLFSLLTSGPVIILNQFFDNTLFSIRLLVISSLCTQILLLYQTSKNLGLSRLHSSLLGCIFLSSASFVFWAGVIETFIFGSLSVSLVLFLSSRVEQKTLSWFLANILCFGFTVTNGLLSLLGGFYFLTRSLFFRLLAYLSLSGLAAIVISYINSSYIKSLAGVANPEFSLTEKIYLSIERLTIFVYVPDNFFDLLVLAKRAISFFLVTGVIPDTAFIENWWGGVTLAPLDFHYSPLGWIASGLWMALLMTGFKAGFSSERIDCKISRILFIFVGFQLLLHTFYGDFPFLYSMHFLPVLVLIIGFGFKEYPSKTLIITGFGFCALALINNINVFLKSVALAQAAAQ